jgi:hypothetical protein
MFRSRPDRQYPLMRSWHSTARFGVVAALFVFALPLSVFGQRKPPTYFLSPCACQDPHGEDRWPAKTDRARVPSESRRIRELAPSDIYAWAPLPGLNERSARKAPEEQQWVRVTGIVRDVRAQRDGDIHFLLQDATGRKHGMILAEVPVGRPWCELRKAVFSWTKKGLQFRPFKAPTGNILKSRRVVTVTGKVFFDTHHAQKNPRFANRNVTDRWRRTAAWEIHPVAGIDEVVEVRRALPVTRRR